jgi:hypothetical protein
LSARTPRPTPICAISPAAWTAVVTSSGAEDGGPLRGGGGGGGVGAWGRGGVAGGVAAALRAVVRVFGVVVRVFGFAAAAFGFATGLGFATAVGAELLTALACRPSRFGRVAGRDPRTDVSGFAVRFAVFFAGFLVLVALSLIGLVWDARSDDLAATLW